MSVYRGDQSFARKPDENDGFRGNQVYHYEVAKGFFIHMVNEAEKYKAIRLATSNGCILPLVLTSVTGVYS